MKLTVQTERFKTAVAKVSKGVGNNPLMPITKMIGIKYKNKKLHLCSTDNTNQLEVILDKVQSEDFSITVEADIFSKLIAKTTSDNITLTAEDNLLKVSGNGTYKIPLTVDEDGIVEFPDITFNKKGAKAEEVLLTTINNIVNVNKSSLAKNFVVPVLTGYYLGDKVVTTDEKVACFNMVALTENCKENNLVLNANMMQLLTLNTQEKIKLYRKGNQVYFDAADCIVCGTELSEKETYPIDEISVFCEAEFPSNCKLPKTLLLSVLDRLSLFMNDADNGGAKFIFTKDGLRINSMQSSSDELINYIESNEFTPFTCDVDIPMLKEQVNAIPSETIELHYNHEAALKLTSGNIIIVMSLLVDEDETVSE